MERPAKKYVEHLDNLGAKLKQMEDNMSAVTNEEIIDLIQKAQKTLPPEKQRPFVERTTERLGTVLSENKKALMGAGIGWVVGEVVDNIPVLGWVTGDYGSVAGALIGAWIGHGKDEKERKNREEIGKIVAEELHKAGQNK